MLPRHRHVLIIKLSSQVGHIYKGCTVGIHKFNLTNVGINLLT